MKDRECEIHSVVNKTPASSSSPSSLILAEQNSNTNSISNRSNNKRSISPPTTPGEALFLSGLVSHQSKDREAFTSAFTSTLNTSKQYRIGSSSCHSTQSIASITTTSGYVTACESENLSFSDDDENDKEELSSSSSNKEVSKLTTKKESKLRFFGIPNYLFSKDKNSNTVKSSPSPILEESITIATINMTSSTIDTATTDLPQPVLVEDTPVTTTTTTTEESGVPKFDVAEHVYETAKSVWIWGKTVKAIVPILDVAEDLATKVVSAATGMNDLETVDVTMKSQIIGLDKEFLNPAILKFMEVVLPLIKKGQQTVKPIATTVGGYVLGPFGLIKPPPTITSSTTTTTNPTQ